MSRFDDMRIISGTGSPGLTAAICSYVGVRQASMVVTKFANDNLFVKLEESVREQDVFIVQSLHRPLSDRIMELLMALDACKRDSAGRITAVLPYYAYSRTDKRDQPRVPITARLLAEILDVPLAIVENRHSGGSTERQMNLLGDVEGKTCVIIDDEVATAVTMIRVSELLRQYGAARIIGACIHPILAEGAITRLRSSPIEQLIATDSLPPPEDEPWDGLQVVSVAPLLGEVILRIHKGISVGAMFAEGHHQLGRW